MALYFLSYDLRKQKDYKTLYDELKKFSAVHVLESTWCFKRLNTSAKGLRDQYKQFIDSDDGLMISEVIDWASFNTLGTPNDLK
jgi:hypothetical protein